jgi:hypothetical protein
MDAVEIRMAILEHIQELLSDLQITDENVDEMSDKDIIEIENESLTLAGYIIDSMGLMPVSENNGTYMVSLKLEDPNDFLDRLASEPIVKD